MLCFQGIAVVWRKGRFENVFDRIPTEKEKNRGAANQGWPKSIEVDPRWLQGLPCDPFHKKLLVGTKIN